MAKAKTDAVVKVLTFQEMRVKHDRLKQTQEVWKTLSKYLDRFLPTDAGDPEEAIPVAGTERVEFDLIQEVKSQVDASAKQCEDDIAAIDNTTFSTEEAK